MITVLTGGTGGAKFVQGLTQVVPPRDLTLIVNTGDDLDWWGLHVSPDLDSILYALAGMLSRERGWGVAGDSFRCLEQMRRLGAPAWFQVGDCDLATHLARTRRLRSGKSLTEATAELARSYGVDARVLPMSDDRVETRVQTASGELSFQEYFVRERYRPEPLAVRFVGAEKAGPAPGALDAIRDADTVLIAPSNPVTSIGPILAIPGIEEALLATNAPIAAVSPIVGGAAVTGPATALMRTQGWEASVHGVLHAYRDFLDVLVMDEGDDAQRALIAEDIHVEVTNTIMSSDEAKAALARFTLQVATVGAPAFQAGEEEGRMIGALASEKTNKD